MAQYKDIKNRFRQEIESGSHLVGVAPGSGLMAKCVCDGGADFLLVLISSIYRDMGRSSMAGYFPISNSNDMVMDFGTKEILTLNPDVPVIFGICGNDPTINVDSYLDEIKRAGFSGVINYPTVGLIDGSFRDVIENAGLGYENEVEILRCAHKKGLFTVAFVFDTDQARAMIEAGVDMICVQLGLTYHGDKEKPKSAKSFDRSISSVEDIVSVCSEYPGVIHMAYGGPIAMPLDLDILYQRTGVNGYIGGSSFGRIPAQEFYTNRAIEFKEIGRSNASPAREYRKKGFINYVDQAKQYIADNYSGECSLKDMAEELHLSRSYLSEIFRREIGQSYPAFLAEYRTSKAKDMIESGNYTLQEISTLCGYSEYGYFSKQFRKYVGMSPKQYQSSCHAE